MPTLKLNYKVPIVAFDNVNPLIKADGSFHLVFSQFTDEGGDPQEADVVAAVTFPNEARWQQIKDGIDRALSDAKKIEP